LPIVAVNFTTARDAIPNYSISIVDQSDEALALGMIQSLEETNAESSFDFRGYNSEALSNFSLAIGVKASETLDPVRNSKDASGHAATARHDVVDPGDHASLTMNPSTRYPTTVFLVDSEHLVGVVAAKISSGSNAELHVIGRVATAAEALTSPVLASSDIVLIDGELPDGNGIELARELRQRYPTLQGLILISHREETDVYGAICFGGAGFATVDIPGVRLRNSIRQVATGQLLRASPWHKASRFS
ncbi:MAG TPA: response regulator transcription factor, partial [Galbitalea sp.]